jgi:hypothetical protein
MPMLTICWSSGIIVTSVSIIADVSGSEDTVQKPQSHPIWGMLSISLPIVEQPALIGASSCLVPGLHDRLTTSIWANVMPEERCFGCLIIPLLFYEARAICVDFVVHSNGFVLLNVISINDEGNKLRNAYSHGTI